MRTFLILLFGLSLPIRPCAGNWEPYNKNHGPFEENEQPRISPIRRCEILEPQDPRGEGPPRVQVFGHKDRKSMPRIRLTRDPRKPSLSVSVISPRQEVISGPQPISRYGGNPEVWWADLNKDGKEDFLVRVWLGGCGTIYTFSCHVAFILSNNGGYKVTTVQTLWSGTEYFVDLKGDGRCQFIQTSFVHGRPERSRDGKFHNFWVYNLLEISGCRLVLTETLDRRFPKWIWYTHKPNHKNTTLITAEQKERLWEPHAKSIFWSPEGAPQTNRSAQVHRDHKE